MKDYYNGEDCLRLIENIINIFEINGFNGFCTGNIIKYIYRYPNKNGVEDLKKAKEYMYFLFCNKEKICICYEIEKLEFLNKQIDKRYAKYFFNSNQRKLLKYFLETLIYCGNKKEYFESWLNLSLYLDSLIKEQEQ